MTEAECFLQLEGRICGELQRMRDPTLRKFWCDGFMPDRNFVATKSGCHIAGKVWMADGNKTQALWNFVLLLGPMVTRRDEVNWSEALPEAHVTGWLSLDFENKFMKIKPRAAYPDPEPTTAKC